MRIENQGCVLNTASSSYVNKTSQSSGLSCQQINGTKLDEISAPSGHDMVEISQRSQTERPTLVQAKEQIVISLYQEKGTEFLEGLKSRITSGDYKIDPYELAGLLLDESIRSVGLLYYNNTTFRAAEPPTAKSDRMDWALSEGFVDFLSRCLVFFQEFSASETQKYQGISRGQIDKLDGYVRVEEVFMLRSKGMGAKRERLVQRTQASVPAFHELLPHSDPDIRQQAKELFGDFSAVVIELKETNLRCNCLTELRLRRMDTALKKMKKQPELQKKHDAKAREELNSVGSILRKV